MTEQKFSEQEIKKAVRQRYAGAIARPASSCCGPASAEPVQIGGSCCAPAPADAMKGKMAQVAGYDEAELRRLPADAVQNSSHAILLVIALPLSYHFRQEESTKRDVAVYSPQ